MSDTTTHRGAPLDSELLVAAAGGDRAAFAQLYDRHAQTVYRFARSRQLSPDEAKDVTHDVFVLAFEKVRSIPLVEGSLLPWLLTTCRYRTLAVRRWQARDRGAGPVDPELACADAGPEKVAEQREFAAAIGSALAELEPRDRRLVALCLEHDYSYAAAARELGTSHGAVRNRLSRVRALLQQRLLPTMQNYLTNTSEENQS